MYSLFADYDYLVYDDAFNFPMENALNQLSNRGTEQNQHLRFLRRTKCTKHFPVLSFKWDKIIYNECVKTSKTKPKPLTNKKNK